MHVDTAERALDRRSDPRDVVALPAGWARGVDVDVADILGTASLVWEYRNPDLGPWLRPEVRVLVPGNMPVDVAVLDSMPNLRMVSIDGTGISDLIDLEMATRRGIAVSNVRDYAADPVAEFTIGLLLALQRHIVAAHSLVRAGGWTPDDFVGVGLREQTLGLVGYGSIGRRVAELARAFGMQVLCTTPHPPTSPADQARATALRFVELPELLASSDVVTLHLPLTTRTRGIIGAAELASMPEGAVLVNTSRGALIDEAALVDALRDGRLAGAALDVTDLEPIRGDSPLLGMNNVLITPHIAAATHAARRDVVVGCLHHIRDFLDGDPHCVANPEVLAPR